MNNQPAYKILASLVQARTNCIKSNNSEWKLKHEERIEQIVADFLPSGSGWDCGTKIDLGNSTGEKLVLYGEWHHMNDGGFYDGWAAHVITVRPSLAFDLSISISGRDRNEIKDYLRDTFAQCLDEILTWDIVNERYTSERYNRIVDPFQDVPSI